MPGPNSERRKKSRHLKNSRVILFSDFLDTARLNQMTEAPVDFACGIPRLVGPAQKDQGHG